MLAFIGQKEKCSVMQLYHYNPLCHYKVKRLIYNESDRKFRKIQTEINHHLEKSVIKTAPNVIAVTKYVTIDRAKEAYDAGLRHFGENRVEGFLEKTSLT